MRKKEAMSIAGRQEGTSDEGGTARELCVRVGGNASEEDVGAGQRWAIDDGEGACMGAGKGTVVVYVRAPRW